MPNNKIICDWDKETGTATFTIKYKNQKFTGVAHCHPIDTDMGNENTGMVIAECRANIKQLQYIKECELKPALAALKHLSANLTGRSANPDSYESRMIQKQIKFYENEIKETKESISLIRDHINAYINQKDEFYKAVRSHRQDKDK